MNRRRVAKVRVRVDLLLETLDFKDASVQDIRYDFLSDSIELLLKSEEFPEVPQGLEPPLLYPIYHRWSDSFGNTILVCREREH